MGLCFIWFDGRYYSLSSLTVFSNCLFGALFCSPRVAIRKAGMPILPSLFDTLHSDITSVCGFQYSALCYCYCHNKKLRRRHAAQRNLSLKLPSFSQRILRRPTLYEASKIARSFRFQNRKYDPSPEEERST